MNTIVKLPEICLTPESIYTKEQFSALAQGRDWGMGKLNMDEVWNKYGKGENVKVAILDTGLDTSHPDLTGSVYRIMNFSRARTGFKDISGHGTHVAGIVGARNNSVGYVGVAPECKFLIAKVLDDTGSGYISDIARGLYWAISNQADVISMSLGGGGTIPEVLKRYIDLAINKGIIVVVAAGNSGTDGISTPGNYSRCITVGATDQNNVIASFSSRGDKIDVVAPGVNIVSTYPNNRYAALSGTSMATPYVAGIAAIYCSNCKRLKLKPSQQEFETLVRNSALDLGTAGFDNNYGCGLIRPLEILKTISPDPKEVTIIVDGVSTTYSNVTKAEVILTFSNSSTQTIKNVTNLS